ncbi:MULTISPECIES: hypothetical protein [unclassified Cupriavidus]|jgi:hypothetical protein|uniref:hypothetical protein n=1 Tax=unclassified Cupriavidus TaxID=2640874 RepID=UPI001C42EBF7|nr:MULTISPECIES: hypothetical protein [unclassified Cupriavidus]
MKVEFFKKATCFVGACVVASSAFAGSSSGKITYINVRDDGLVYFALSGAPTNRPGCASASTYFMIKDEKSNIGKQQLALLLTAVGTDKAVSVEGTGQCSRYVDGEDVRFVLLHNS